MKLCTYDQFKAFVAEQREDRANKRPPEFVEIDQQIHDHFLGCVPPAYYWGHFGFCCGEPYDSTIETDPDTGKRREVDVSQHFFLRNSDTKGPRYYSILGTRNEVKDLLHALPV